MHTFPELCSKNSLTLHWYMIRTTRKLQRFLKNRSVLADEICTTRYLQSLFWSSFDFYWSCVLLRDQKVLPVPPSHIYFSDPQNPSAAASSFNFHLRQDPCWKEKCSPILQSFPELPDLPVNPQGWCISPSTAGSFVLWREHHHCAPSQERLKKISSQLSWEASTCLVNIWSFGVNDALLRKHQVMLWCSNYVSLHRQSPQIVTVLPKDCHTAIDKWSRSSNTLPDSNRWWILQTKIRKGHFLCLPLEQGSRGQGILQAGTTDDLFVLCKVKWESGEESPS